MKKIGTVAAALLMTGCLNTDGNLESSGSFSSTGISAGDIGAGVLPGTVSLSSIQQLPAPLSGSCSNNQILQWGGSNWNCADPAAGGGGDNLGSHIALQNLDLSTFSLVGNGGANGVSIAADGKVGIGTASPAEVLAVTNPAETKGEFQVQDGNWIIMGEGRTVAGASGLDLIATVGTSEASMYKAATGHLIVDNSMNGDFKVASSGGGFNSLVVKDSGNIGVGTAAPAEILTVTNPADTKGEFQVENGNWISMGVSRTVAGASGLTFVATTGTSEGSIYKAASGHLIVDNAMNGDFKVVSNSVFNALVVKDNGNVGLGTASPGQKLQVVGNAAKSVGGTSWTVSSDRRLKDVHGDYEKGLKEILELRPVEFNYKKDNLRKHDSKIRHQGFIAQEVLGEDGEEGPFPESVEEGSDGYLFFNMHAINVAVVNAVKSLFEAIQHNVSSILAQDKKILKLMEKNKELELRLLSLESRLNSLENKK